MKKSKRIMAIVGVVALVSLYLASLITAFFVTEASAALFKISIISTVAIPILIYAYTLVCKVFGKKIIIDESGKLIKDKKSNESVD